MTKFLTQAEIDQLLTAIPADGTPIKGFSSKGRRRLNMKMECFIIENGVERKAELEDILLMLGVGLQYIIRDTFEYGYLPYAIAHLPDGMKNLVYGNSLLRIRGRLEKEVLDIESKCKKNDSRIQNAREKLISFIGENMPYWPANRVVWKEAKPKEPDSPIEKLIHDIEKACALGILLSVYDTNKMSEEDVKNAFMTFQDRKEQLKKITALDIDIKYLPAASLLFETGGIERLGINGKFDGTWPEFLENYRNLTSIDFNLLNGLTEFPLWIRNAVSLRRLNIYFVNTLPEWIGDLQSLTELYIQRCSSNLKTLPDSICNLKNLAKLSVIGLTLEKLPDSIGSLSSLKELYLNDIKTLTYLPDSIGNLQNLAALTIHESGLEKLPDSIGNLSSLKELCMIGNRNLASLPDSIGSLKNLVKLELDWSALQKLPDSIGNLSSLKELSLGTNFNLTSLPDSIGNLINLTQFDLDYSSIKILPESIGNLQNLAKLSLKGRKIEILPDSIGRLKNLTTLDLRGSGIEKLPETIADCTALECVDIRNTKITSYPEFISSIKELKRTMEVMPEKRGISYLSFCNYYYTLVEKIIRFNIKARRYGLHSLEKEIDGISGGFFWEGIRHILNGNGEEIIQNILTLKIEREGSYYKKKLMEIALEGILCIERGYSTAKTALMLAVMVDIKNNQLDAVCAKYLTGDYDAFDNIDFKSAMQPEEEREELLFIKRAFEISKIKSNEGIIGIEKRLDKDGITARDVFEYGISMLVTGLDYKDIDKYLIMLIAYETNPARKNLALAKKEAVRMLSESCNPYVIKQTLLAFFDDDVAEEYPPEL
jgi:Leucine-rich repeat (LRR) protein/uncharacterized protein YeeX (DUF496 family)